MADKYLSAYYDGNNGNKIYLELHVYTVATSIANNTTTERADLYAVVNDASYQWYNGYGSEAFIGINGNNTTKTVTFDYRTTGVKALISTWDTVVKHDNNGAASIGISAHHYSGVGLGNASVSGTYTCDTIPRYATSNQSLNSKTETTIKMNWSSDNTIDYIWYSTNNGSSWTGVDVTDGKSGTYTISGLSANTSYNIKTRVRRKDSQLTTDSSTLAVKTYSYPAQSLKSKAETTITINWSADSTVDMIYYSTNDGSTWSSGISVNATSGSYTISGLSENTTYKVKTRIRRKSTQTLSNTSSLSVTTYSFPHCVSSPNFTIGDAIKLDFYNPLNRTITVKIIGNNNSEIGYWQGNSTTISGFDDDWSKTHQYSSIPNSQSSYYKVQVEYGDHIKIRDVGNTYKIKGTEKPTFTNFTFADTSTNAINLTGNNQIFIKGVSDVAVTISTANKAVGNNSASISKYRITIGNTIGNLTYSDSASVSYTFANVTSGTISVSAIDSRGLETTVTKTTTFKDWWLPTITNVDIYRENGIGTKCLFELDGKYWNNNFGSVDNIFLTAYYRYKKSTDSTYSSYINIGNRFTYSDGNYSSKSAAFLPTSDYGTTAVEFEVGIEYNIQFMVQDKTGTFTSTLSKVLTLNSGIPCTSKQKNSDGTYSIGINKLPDENFALSINGGLKVDGEGHTNGMVVSSSKPQKNEGIWLQKGKNLFNKNNLSTGYRLGSDGLLFADSSYSASNFIPVKPNTTYSVNWAMETRECVCYYDENETFISRNVSTNPFTTPENCKYIRASRLSTKVNTAQIELGATATDYEEYKEKKIYTKNNNGGYEEFLNADEVISNQFKINNRYDFTNFNSFTKNGFYMVNVQNCSNAPNPYATGMLLVFGSYYISQLFIADLNKTTVGYIRMSSDKGKTWNNWSQITS